MAPGRGLFVVLFAGVALAGCVSDDGPVTEDGLDVAAAPEEVVVTDRLGAIKGSLTSDLFEPLSGGTVTIVETGRETKVARNGHFTFNDVEPGAYVLLFLKPGYMDAQRQVTVTAGGVTEVFVQLVPLAGEDPWTELVEISGQVTYDVHYHVEVDGQCQTIENQVLPVRTCGGPSTNLIFGIHLVNFTDSMQTVLFEAMWRSAGPIGENLFMYTLCPTYSEARDQDYYGTPCYIPAEGTKSPLVIRLDRAAVEPTIPYTGNWYTRINGGYGLLGTYGLIGADVGASYEQKFTLFFSFFHGEAAPEGYSALPDA